MKSGNYLPTMMSVRYFYSIGHDLFTFFAFVKFLTHWQPFVGLTMTGIAFLSGEHSVALSRLFPRMVFSDALTTYYETTFARFVTAVFFFSIINLLAIKTPVASSEKAWYGGYDIVVIIAKVQNTFASLSWALQKQWHWSVQRIGQCQKEGTSAGIFRWDVTFRNSIQKRPERASTEVV